MWGSGLALGVTWPAVSGPVCSRRKRCRKVGSRSTGVENSVPAYFDCGNASRYCGHCGAWFWYDERALNSRVANPTYNQCCKGGSVVLPSPVMPPSPLLAMYEDSHFMRNIRAYNCMFSMTSFGGKVDESVNEGHGPYVFKVSGQVSHHIGSLCPQPLDAPRFLQLYVYDTSNEVENRLHFFRASGSVDGLKPDIVDVLGRILSSCNNYVRAFRTAVEVAEINNMVDYEVRLYNNVPDHRYGLPHHGTLGAIVVGEDANASVYDIIVRSRSDRPQRISKLHQSYMPLQYPLLFPYGEVGWSPSLKLRSAPGQRSKALTVNMYYSFLLHTRRNTFSLLLRGGKLLQQFLIDAYLCVEESRLDYFRKNQNSLRSEYIAGVFDALSKGDSVGREIGKRIFLPSSFVGGPRYMYKHYQDALAICRVYGNPQYFITFTCNARWPEITRFMDTHDMGHCQNRPDIISRVFSMKVGHFVDFLKTERPFGAVSAYLYTVEFQKRGLPHCHTLIWVDESSKIRTPTDVDRYITAELPDPTTEHALYTTITTCMIHGPCGASNPTAPCMRDGACKKKFPKAFAAATTFDKNGYVHYKRNDVATHTMQNGMQTDNGFVVPYNKLLCSRFDAHINVEYCGWNMMIKYLFKYISKGVERVAFSLRRADNLMSSTASSAASTSNSSLNALPENVNEIEQFVDGRFICPHEAAWRLLNFSIHERQPAVQILHVHLEQMQTVTFKDGTDLERLATAPNFGNSTLSRWLIGNKWDEGGRELTYIQYPQLFTWNAAKKDWFPRSRNTITPVGRMVYIYPTAGELFYLRMLLSHQKGCRCFADIRTVAGVTYASYRLACEALGLVGDDKEWLTAFNEASLWASSPELRNLFCNLLLLGDVSDPMALWENAWIKMGDDITRMLSDSAPSHDSVVPEEVLRHHILFEIERILNAAIPPKSLALFSLPLPPSHLLLPLTNRLLLEEKLYDKAFLANQHSQMSSRLNPGQLEVYNRIRTDESLRKQTLAFVYGHGGTGKTFLWSTIIAYLRSVGKVVLAVASSGIASLLLPNGRTAHSRFNIPINLLDTSVCNIKKNTQLSELLKQTYAIVWDEATMMDRRCFEAVDRTFRDVLDEKDKPFGGISMLLGGDFRQTLPIKRKKGHQDIMSSTLPNSRLWPHFSLYKLSYNMRLSYTNMNDSAQSNSAEFAQWLLDIGNGTVGTPETTNPRYSSIVEIPEKFLIVNNQSGLEQLVTFVYVSAVLFRPDPEVLRNRAIVCPKNCTTDDINSMVLDRTPGTITSYYSADSITAHTQKMSDLDLLYPEEYLNQLTFPSLPLHRLDLKKSVPIILLRNMSQKNGLCNGTRLIVTHLLPTVIEAVIMTGTCIGQKVYLPRIKFVHHDPELPFAFNRKQFPCKVSYAITINKSQGQSLQRIGLFLPSPQKNMAHIADLEYGCAGLPLQMRILRKWKPHFRTKETWFLATVERGDVIAILGEQQGQTVLESRLKVGSCYIMEQYSCNETQKYQRTIRNSVHLIAGEASQIALIEDAGNIPKTSFDFATIDELSEFVHMPMYFPDFIGRYKKQTHANKRNGDRFLLLTLTTATGQDITATLWNECLEDFEKVDVSALSVVEADTVIVLTNIKPTIFANTLRISSTDATHVYIDPELPAASKKVSQLMLASTQPSATASYIVMTLEELQNKLYETLQRKTVAVDARITEAIFDNSWYVATCAKCRSQTSKQNQTWFCPNHGRNCDPTFFYNMRVMLSDGTSSFETAATESCMQKVMGHTCKEMIIDQGYEDRKRLPPNFKRYGMDTYRYHIEMTKKSTPDNINFIIVNKEIAPTQLQPTKNVIPATRLANTLTTTTESTHMTPPPYSPATPNTETGPTDKSKSTTQLPKTVPTARQLTFEETGTTAAVHTSPALKESVRDINIQEEHQQELTAEHTSESTGTTDDANKGTPTVQARPIKTTTPATRPPNRSTAASEATHIIPLPKNIKSTTTEIEPSGKSKSKKRQTKTVSTAKKITSEGTGTIASTNPPPDSEEALTDINIELADAPIITSTTSTDELETLNPTKRERFSE